ncbi:hypothetical protein [Burkholderia stagnalis]|uniref:hypothetical protein n=1 Tax=Burkholderia stagnalis TaxID=1503054 RepID=UPI000F55D6C6|nr:hypothetical protein [Burkholderia stagnalis]RQQ43552.1 hypothetical protein DF145_29235 [Burkholderia stagnalis]RQX90999.1 hypothetical protein DF121_28795 [Burkholderia stagnalis]RQY09565.1 hypothetical protein DF115_29085 [Burkholderia stagnalis]RQY25769.1 hypothetical protein DF114_29105 [Burkholderia stagnalis]
MIRIRVVSMAAAVSVGLALAAAPAAFAQGPASDAVPSSAAAPTSKQMSKAQRKAARKAARQKRNEDLNAIRKDGYSLTGDRSGFPQNGQGAAPKAADGAASAPAQ